eukprot:11826-Eustigmatos_ZCMA.PRE.1
MGIETETPANHGCHQLQSHGWATDAGGPIHGSNRSNEHPLTALSIDKEVAKKPAAILCVVYLTFTWRSLGGREVQKIDKV